MSRERRYNEQEIAAIFKLAAAEHDSTQRPLSSDAGLTLAELKQIGKEVGIAPALIARAAATVDRTISAPPPTTFLGVPVSAARTVDLPGSFSGDDWGRLVTDLHETVQGPGRVQRSGSLRQWTSQTLHVLVGPTESGHRLRLRAQNYLLEGGLMGGMLLFVMGLFFMLLVAAKGDFATDWAKTLFVSMFSVVGLVSFGVSAYRLPRWRTDQEHQMEAVASRALERAETKRSVSPQEVNRRSRSPLDPSLEDASAIERARMQRSARF